MTAIPKSSMRALWGRYGGMIVLVVDFVVVLWGMGYAVDAGA